MIVAVAVTEGGEVDPRWGRAERVALADVTGGTVASWAVHDVGWAAGHDAATEARHHAAVARFLRQQHVEVVVAHHVGTGMRRMLDTMGVDVHLGAAGDARSAVLAAVA